MNPKIVFVTGGSRSGKSIYAEELVKATSERVVYIATAIPFDDEMQDRVKKHRDQRPASWMTLEQYFDIHKVIPELKVGADCILLDCITIMVSNIMFAENKSDWNNLAVEEADALQAKVLEQVDLLMKALRTHGMSAVIVSNELGMGIVPDNKLSRVFRDIAGKANQLVAAQSDEAWMVVSGIPLKLK